MRRKTLLKAADVLGASTPYPHYDAAGHRSTLPEYSLSSPSFLHLGRDPNESAVSCGRFVARFSSLQPSQSMGDTVVQVTGVHSHLHATAFTLKLTLSVSLSSRRKIDVKAQIRTKVGVL